MAEIQNRTLICSVLFIDIVEYSRKPVVEQLHLKDRFNELLTEALADVAFMDRVIIDTGDGAACTFTGDPEDALFVAARLQQSVADQAEADMSQLAARVGINLGPVRLVKDINGQPNVIGDGINVAQRIMNFAQPGQVLVSHSYYEAVSRLSDESSNLFTYQGSRTDKHIRDHEVYALCLTAAAEQKRSNDKRKAIARDSVPRSTALQLARQFCADLKARLRRKPQFMASAAVAAAVATAVAYGAYNGEFFADARTARLAGTTPALHASVSLATMEAASLQAMPEQPTAPGQPETQTQPSAEPTPTAPERAPKPASESTKAAAEPAVLQLAIAPWGKVYVDGKERGASPPLRELRLPEGKHKVEVKNAGFPDHVVVVQAKAGERIRVKHKFN